jgi:hypothetical protein
VPILGKQEVLWPTAARHVWSSGRQVLEAVRRSPYSSDSPVLLVSLPHSPGCCRPVTCAVLTVPVSLANAPTLAGTGSRRAALPKSKRGSQGSCHPAGTRPSRLPQTCLAAPQARTLVAPRHVLLSGKALNCASSITRGQHSQPPIGTAESRCFERGRAPPTIRRGHDPCAPLPSPPQVRLVLRPRS